jgi:hypothetical protein
MKPHQAILRSAIFCISCGPLLGCGEGEAPSGRTPTRDTIAGVEVVRNSSTPRDGVRAGPAWLWHAPTTADVARFGEWESAVKLVVGGERVYVLDRMASRVYVVAGVDGTVEGTVGQRGAGPGEFDRPYGLAVSADELIVGNGAGASLERFRPDGSYLGSIAVGRLGFDLLSLASGELYLNSLLGSDGGWGRVSAEGSVIEVAWPTPVEARFDDCTRLGGGRGVLVRVACTSPIMQMASTDGRPVREITIDIPPRRPPAGMVEDHLAEVRQLMAQSGMTPDLIEAQVRQEKERLAVLPVVRGVRVDSGTGTIAVWEQIPEDLGGGAAKLHMVAASGEYLSAIEFAESWIDYAIHDRRIYALVLERDTGLVGLVAYPIEEVIVATSR